MALKGDHIIVNYMTEYEGADLKNVASKMRSHKPEFSDDPGH